MSRRVGMSISERWALRGRRVTARLSTLPLAAAGVMTGVLVGGAPAAAVPSDSGCAATAGSVDEAAVMARRCNRAVEVASVTTETTRVLENPDGSSTLEMSPAPSRVRGVDGSWRPVDLSLARRADGWAPRASTVDVRFSAGGEEPLVTVQSGKRSFTLDWPGSLPAPVVAGDSATYPGVLPGVDLVVTATSGGFTHVLVVHDATAARNPALRRVEYQLGGAGVHVQRSAHDGLRVLDDDGAVVLVSGAAVMWDSAAGAGGAKPARGERSAERSSARGSGDGARTATARTELAGNRLAVLPDAGLLETAAWPLFVDPAFHTPAAQRWAYSNSANENNDTTTVRMGRSPNSSAVYRPLFEFPVGVLGGSRIISATFQIQLYHSWSCGATPATLWRANGIAATPKNPWANSGVNTYLDTQSAGANKDDCYTAAQPTMFFGGNLAGDVQAVANARWSTYTLALTAMSSNGAGEGTTDRWKRFNVGTALLSVHFNHGPRQPALTDLSMDPSLTCSALATYLNAENGVTLRANLSDPNNDNVKAQWQLSGVPTQYAPADSALAAAGSFTTTVPAAAFTDGATYTWSVRGHDGTDAGSWSPSCSFVVDNSLPGNPTAASTDLALGTGLLVPDAPASAVVGRPAAVTVTKPVQDTNIAGYLIGVLAGAEAAPSIWVPVGADGSAVVPVVPVASGSTVNHLSVKARSLTGQTGATVVYRFKANAATTAPRVLGDATGDGLADVTMLADVGGGNSALWRWNLTASGGMNVGAVAPQDVAGIYPTAVSRAASGDFDGDRLADVATFSQQGANVAVSVQRSDGNALLGTNVATLAGWDLARMRIFVANFDNDAAKRDDLAIAYHDGGYVFTYRVLLATGTPGSPGFAAPATWYTQPASGNHDFNQTKFFAGDFDGDQRADIGWMYNYGGCHTRIGINYSTGTAFALGVFAWDSGPLNFCWDASDPVAGDFDADGRADVATFYRFGNCANALFALFGNADRTVTWGSGNWSAPEHTWCGHQMQWFPGDFDGDGRSDMGFVYRCCGPHQAKLYTLSAQTGRTFAAPALRWEGATGPFSVAAARVDTTARYQIVNVNSGKCLTVPGGDSALLIQQTCTTAGNATFTFQREGGAFFKIHPVQAPASCLDLLYGSSAINTPIQQVGCHNHPAQLFTVNYQTGFTDVIVNIGVYLHGQCVDIPNAATTDGTPVNQHTCNGSVAQQFRLRTIA